MKKETYANKLFDLLGIKQEAEKLAPDLIDPTGKKRAQKYNKYQGVSEEEIQNFRAMQGLIYFLQAPELFSSRICPHCGEHFLVSRQFVAFCSYTCIKKDLEAKGLEWRKGNDIEAIVRDVYDGNEPLWISPNMVNRLKAVLETTQESLLSPTSTQSQDKHGSSETLADDDTSSALLTTT